MFFSVANAKCKKDNSQIVQNTFGPLLNEELKDIRETGCLSMFLVPTVYCAFGTEEQARREHGLDDLLFLTVPVTLWFAGDLLWYATALGKEGYAGWWCSYCKLFKTKWQVLGHTCGELWTLAGLSQHSTRIESGQVNGKKPAERCGVKEQPLFPSVDVDHYVFPTLHLTIGPVNAILDNFISEMQAAGELYTDEYY